MNKMSFIKFVDNSGAKEGKILHFYNKIYSRNLYAQCLVTIRRVVPNNAKKLKKGDKLKCLMLV